MRFMVLVKSDANSESGVMPTEQELSTMTRYNEELAKAGVLVAAEGLLSTASGAKVRFDKGAKSVIDGPFSETKELIAGFWILRCETREEAIEWIKRAPFGDATLELEVRQVSEPSDFGDAFTPELQAREARLGEQMKDNARR